MNILEALAKLDQSNDEHWTADGLPRVDVIGKMIGQTDLKRQDITNAAPEFVRGATLGEANGEDEEGQQEGEPQGHPEGEQEQPSGDPSEVDEEDGDIETIADLTDEEILAATPADLLANIELMDLWLAASERHQIALHKKMKEITDEVNQFARAADAVHRLRMRARRTNPKKDGEAIRSFLANQRKAREERARRAQAFIAAGTTAEDVAKELRGKSALDVAMSQRKPKPGSTRPAPNMPVRR